MAFASVADATSRDVRRTTVQDRLCARIVRVEQAGGTKRAAPHPEPFRPPRHRIADSSARHAISAEGHSRYSSAAISSTAHARTSGVGSLSRSTRMRCFRFFMLAGASRRSNGCCYNGSAVPTPETNRVERGPHAQRAVRLHRWTIVRR